MNNDYLYEVSCYDCVNCTNRGDRYCQSACARCYAIAPQVFAPPQYYPLYTRFPMRPLPRSFNMLWYNPSQYQSGYYYGAYRNPSMMY